ncbi:hypothetical protein [Streptomyces sp. NRRL B-24484]|uniref:hypothetical protein n=1 Tax=Streptomyces sp. NRRL B-24484 TaxID=1463833 RepID=UPI0004C0301D|nr:hypothetical protein [Streptomyces sp. NRRL B-24484]
MKLYLSVPVLLVALLIAASGVAAVSRGWVLPMNRRHIHAPRRHGWGQLVTAFALCWQLFFVFVIDTPGTRQWGALSGTAMLLTGLAVMITAQRAPRKRNADRTP